MIFISHTSSDKSVVEPIAIKLAEVFGRDRIFYDSWSIQPGDGIIQKMNEGLSECKFFFLFMSQKSLTSAMVGLEWYNAVMKAVDGGMKFVPVRLDRCEMPSLLTQTLYLDLLSNGLEIVTRQMIDIVNGDSTFRPRTESFHNLKAYVNMPSPSECHVEIRADLYMEPVSRYAITLANRNTKAFCTSESMTSQDYRENLQMDGGQIINAHIVGTDRATSPGFPVRIRVSSSSGEPLRELDVMHAVSETQFELIPIIVDETVRC